ncbi:hypothetical protein ES705_12816 [subsurface metagenome]
MISVVQLLLNAISPTLRALIVNFVKDLSIQAAKTKNPFDDIVALLLKALLDIKD